MAVKDFLTKAFSDMKESAQAQHEVDKANLEAAKARIDALNSNEWVKIHILILENVKRKQNLNISML